MARRKQRESALEDAINAHGIDALADHLGITTQAIAQWWRVPATRCLAVEGFTGVSRYRLRPDIYGVGPRIGNGRLVAA